MITLLDVLTETPTLFNDISLPEGIDRETLKTNLLAETAELELLYQNPDTMKVLIEAWAKSMQRPWERMLLALNEEYNPLHNYDRTEEWEDTGEGSSTRGTNANGTNTRQNAGWNPGAGLADAEKETSNTTGTETFAGESTNTRKGRAYGNIGVTTSATMLKEEVETRQKYNIYDIIVADFKSRFCLMVY